jgi:hypothetical protein
MDTSTGQSVAGSGTPNPVRPTHESGSSSVPVAGWTITFQGHTWTANDVNTAHLVSVSELLGGSPGWEVADPRTGPKTLATWVAVLYAATTRSSIDEVLPLVFAMTIPELLACIR